MERGRRRPPCIPSSEFRLPSSELRVRTRSCTRRDVAVGFPLLRFAFTGDDISCIADTITETRSETEKTPSAKGEFVVYMNMFIFKKMGLYFYT